MKVCIIGAGVAGLCSARQMLEGGHEIEVLEMGPDLGGLWLYTNEVGIDKDGFPVYSAMYQGLRANHPKNVMCYPDFPVPESMRSYLTQEEVWSYLDQYTKRFDLRPHIKFNHMVTDVRPLPNGKWGVTHVEKSHKKESTVVYDAVMVCNGHYNDPAMPEIKGQELFKGFIGHSHDYRKPDPYKGKRVLIIGAGHSGMDLALQISKVAEYVVLSHHVEKAKATDISDRVIKKPDIKCIAGPEEVVFKDETSLPFDVIYACTGYNFSFPFLHESCGITITDNQVEPIFKHMFNILHPTMCFIGIPFNVCAFQLFDLQARVFRKYLNNEITLPSQEEMRADTERDMQERYAKGMRRKQAHQMGPNQQKYYDELAALGKTDPIPPVIVKLRDESVRRLYEDLKNFREDRYKIVDPATYVKVN